MTNIPHGYNDEGGRGLSDRELEHIESNWDSIEAYEDRNEPSLECYNCGKKARREGARIVKSRLVCEDCYVELNLEKN